MVGPLSFSLSPVSRVPMVPNLISWRMNLAFYDHQQLASILLPYGVASGSLGCDKRFCYIL
jgi:hypothetical protein